MVKHTPGPWYAVGSWVEHANDEVPDICNCDPESMGQAHLGRSYDEMLANSRLIAAAPDMLKMLQLILRIPETPTPIVNTASAIIAKIKG